MGAVWLGLLSPPFPLYACIYDSSLSESNILSPRFLIVFAPPPPPPLPPPLSLLLSFPAKNSPPHQRPLWRPGDAQAISGYRESLVDDLRGGNSLETAVDQRSRVGLKEAGVRVAVGVRVG